ncbi:gluconate 2-dehydrogenase subunit 3 family protein [Vibrio viridaestus]|uniref:Gluconate 2-dehydrogenase subunit 3 family protein n=1 Tax=Vibrio viridaestus TaxID=2487322 RepID=A0A3N9TAN0_9VIBR|nr:gluconate 2-dehydrogenase subunit 3 family protein [Vibrio viridaestus]RQW61181.1 gluconate 2-dehydrogenase subunit 3 family protein [Vibrio viridaestus]
MKRRTFLGSIAALGAASTVLGKEISGGQPWTPGEVSLPKISSKHGGLQFLSKHELETIEEIAERFIPSDEFSLGGRDAGCAIFIDRQLAGDYGKASTVYRRGRFIKGTKEQGPQTPYTPAERYRRGLIALDLSTNADFNKNFKDLAESQQNLVLSAMEKNEYNLGKEIDTKEFFELLLQNVREGFLSDPIYGGNKDMTSWKMIGFPGARYDFRDLLGKKGQRLDIIPTSLIDNSL